jgi:uncharacterized protein YgbK (DUF1537 family)
MQSFEIGPVIAPGVPLLAEIGTQRRIVLKSGNFGGKSFFADAAQMMEATNHG